MIDVMADAGSIPAYPYEDADIVRLAQPQIQSLTLKCGVTCAAGSACAKPQHVGVGGLKSSRRTPFGLTSCPPRSVRSTFITQCCATFSRKTRTLEDNSNNPSPTPDLILLDLRLQEVETALREALQEKELLERKLARLQASREGEVAALKVGKSKTWWLPCSTQLLC